MRSANVPLAPHAVRILHGLPQEVVLETCQDMAQTTRYYRQNVEGVHVAAAALPAATM